MEQNLWQKFEHVRKIWFFFQECKDFYCKNNKSFEVDAMQNSSPKTLEEKQELYLN